MVSRPQIIRKKKEVLVRVKDTRGVSHESKPISVNLKGKPILLLEGGVGPNQVLREAVDLKIRSNINLDSVNYISLEKIQMQ